MSLFKKPKKNIRRRIVGENDDDDENENTDKGSEGKSSEDNTSAQVSKVPGKIKEKKKEKQRKQTLLSFEEDLNEGDDGEVFQVKKSTHSKKIMKLLDRERKKKKEEKEPEFDNLAPVIVEVPLKRTNTVPILNGREAEFADHTVSDEEDQEDEAAKQRKHIFNQPDVKLLLQSGRIPDAAMIHAARKRRQMAREMGGDYIPVDDTKRYENEKSRLVREDDNDVSDDEGEDGNLDGERLKFSVPTASADREKRREAIFAAQEAAGSEESDRGDDEELEKWESQQIRKGVTGAQITAVQQGTLFVSHPGVMPHEVHDVSTAVPSTPMVTVPSESGVVCGGDHSLATEEALSRLAAQTGEKVTPESVKRRLGERLASLREVSRRHQADKERLAEEMASLRKEAGDREGMAPSLARRFRFYQELRGYVTDLVECLDEKVSLIEGVESRMHNQLWRKRRDELMARRRQDVRDQAKELAPIATNRVPASGVRANPEEEEAQVRRAAEREGRRSRRRRARQMAARSTSGSLKHYEGMSSDDEQTELEVVAYRKQKEIIEGDAHKIFEDVVEEFCTVRGVLGRWEQWRSEEENSYREAYASLCLPKVLAPILRLNLLSWNPIVIQDDSSGAGPCGFEGRKWFDLLLMYGLRDTETEETLRNDPDLKLVSLVVEKVILPKVTQLVDCSWDPMSTSQTLRLVRIVAKIVEEYPTVTPYIPPSSTSNTIVSASSAKPLRALLVGIVDRLREAVDNDVFIPIHPKHVMDAKGGAMGTFFQRQFWSAVKLLRNVVAWAGIISDSILGDLALHSILNRYLLAALRACPDPIDAVSKCRMIVSSLPRWWLSASNSASAKEKGEEINPQLKMFASQLLVLGQSLDPNTPAGREASEEVTSILKLLGTKEAKKA
ncbi:PAX3- and PAX7-binding protein 1 [Ischnura elegans]|uniref:PAX3- and PAX7-binding protein 1 n=1 Tax=Ischnura elegans TaxID=197161 RepID=UPI001ED8B8DA|nr:PAX3- and PAX7-binding protein 1 [Ischnura elegans]